MTGSRERGENKRELAPRREWETEQRLRGCRVPTELVGGPQLAELVTN